MKYNRNFKITFLAINEIFVYGANEAGIHGAGAAKDAMNWGAVYGKFKFSGKTYGIPTKDSNLGTLPLSKIKFYVDEFLIFATDHPEYAFLVTPIGCGLAGYSEKDIAPLFKRALDMENVDLPESFRNFLNKSMRHAAYPPTNGWHWRC